MQYVCTHDFSSPMKKCLKIKSSFSDYKTEQKHSVKGPAICKCLNLILWCKFYWCYKSFFFHLKKKLITVLSKLCISCTQILALLGGCSCTLYNKNVQIILYKVKYDKYLNIVLTSLFKCRTSLYHLTL